MARPRSTPRELRPGLVIGPTTAGADVQIEGSSRAAGRRGGARADRKIEDDIRRRLRAQSHAGFGEIAVTASAGHVQLDGLVGDRATRRVAGQIADAVPGVKVVDNRLAIGAVPGVVKLPARRARRG